ncbi:bacteriohemerythrin [Sulfurospirillum sp.]|uniref:bacteriohemerythrin n=1 Tax=Sulfurospirillum sp. TaxID=2053622 RepID=UPI002FDDB1E1
MMPQWNDKYKLDHDLLDQQHKELFKLANFVYNLDPTSTKKNEVATLFKAFYQYMDTHFKDEEAYMASISYPLLDEHKKLHQEIIANLNHILKTKKTVQELQASMKYAAQKWLSEHILENDLKIIAWAKG